MSSIKNLKELLENFEAKMSTRLKEIHDRLTNIKNSKMIPENDDDTFKTIQNRLSIIETSFASTTGDVDSSNGETFLDSIIKKIESKGLMFNFLERKFKRAF